MASSTTVAGWSRRRRTRKAGCSRTLLPATNALARQLHRRIEGGPYGGSWPWMFGWIDLVEAGWRVALDDRHLRHCLCAVGSCALLRRPSPKHRPYAASSTRDHTHSIPRRKGTIKPGAIGTAQISDPVSYTHL